MKCSVCQKDIPWGEPTVAKKGQGVRHETCVPEKLTKSRSQVSSQGKTDLYFTARSSPAVCIEVEGEQGSRWFGKTEAEALAHARSTMARKHKSNFTHVEMEDSNG